MDVAVSEKPAKSSKPLHDHLWQPGKSANPGGRPAIIRPIRELARGYSADAIHALASIMKDVSQSASARVAAASELLDRAWGKAPQKVDVDVTIFDAMDPATRAALDGIVAILEQVQVRPVVTIDAQAVAIEPEKSTDSVDPMSPTP